MSGHNRGPRVEAQEGGAGSRQGQALHQAHQGDHRRRAHGRGRPRRQRPPPRRHRRGEGGEHAAGQHHPGREEGHAASLEGVSYEEAVYEGVRAGRRRADCRVPHRQPEPHRRRRPLAFAKGGGNLAAEGAVSWNFEKRGVVEVKPGPTEDQVTEAAIDAGAEDVVSLGADGFEVRTHPNDLHGVAATLEKRLKLGGRRITFVPKETVRARRIPTRPVHAEAHGRARGPRGRAERPRELRDRRTS